MESAQFASGLDIADATFNKLNYGNFSLGGTIDIEMDNRPAINKNILDFPISVIGRAESEKISEIFAFGADFHGVDSCKKCFILQAKTLEIFIKYFSCL